MPVCNLFSFAEVDEENEGWIIAKRIGYCGTCKNDQDIFNTNTKTKEDAESSRFVCLRLYSLIICSS